MLNSDADFLELQFQVEINLILYQMKWTPVSLCALGINSEQTEDGDAKDPMKLEREPQWPSGTLIFSASMACL